MSTYAPPNLRIPALVVGILAANVLGATIVIAGLKAGITPGVSPIVLLVAWAVLFRSLRAENASEALNIAQVAGSAGALVAAGVIFTAPLLPILSRSQGLEYTPIPTLYLISAALIGSLIGFGWVGLNARRVLADPTLPAPEAKACAQMVEVAVASVSDASQRDRDRPTLRDSLIPGMLAGVGVPLLSFLGITRAAIPLLSKKSADAVHSFKLELPVIPIYIGIGALLSLATALVAFSGSVVRLTGDFILAGTGSMGGAWPSTSMRWVGGAAMTVAVVASLVRVLRLPKLTATSVNVPNPHTLLVRASTTRWLGAAIVLGALALLAGILTLTPPSAFSITLALAVPLLTAVLVTLGAMLSLQIGSSASPVSGAVFLMTLVLSLIALFFGRGTSTADLQLITLVLVAACVAVCASNDSSQDFKTLQLCNLPIERGFLGQFLGLITASVTVPFVFTMAERAYGLGTDALPAPQGQLFAMLVEGLLFDGAIPVTPLLIGAGIGVFAVAVEAWGRRRGHMLPAMAFAIGLYLPPYLGIGLVIGALARELGRKKSAEAAKPVLLASGLITGAASFDILLGIALLSGANTSALQTLNLPAALSTALSAGALAVICWLIYRSARRSTLNA